MILFELNMLEREKFDTVLNDDRVKSAGPVTHNLKQGYGYVQRKCVTNSNFFKCLKLMNNVKK